MNESNFAPFAGTHGTSFNLSSGQGGPTQFDSVTRINHTSTDRVAQMPDIADLAKRTFSVELNKPIDTPGRLNDTMRMM